MPKVKMDKVAGRRGSDHPAPLGAPVAGRMVQRVGAAAGLEDYGVSAVTVPPGGWSSQRHWHEADDEFLVMVAGELVLVENDSRSTLRPGDCAAFPKNDGNGHHLINESDRDARFVVVGANKGGTRYSDVDLLHAAGEDGYRHEDGTPY